MFRLFLREEYGCVCNIHLSPKTNERVREVLVESDKFIVRPFSRIIIQIVEIP